MMTPNIHPKKNNKNFWLDEELAKKVCTPDKTNKECAAELGVSASYIGRWRRKNGCPSSYVENRKEVATRRKEKEALKAPEKGLVYDAKQAKKMKMTYGQYKAMQFEEQKKARASLLLGKKV